VLSGTVKFKVAIIVELESVNAALYLLGSSSSTTLPLSSSTLILSEPGLTVMLSIKLLPSFALELV